jgi:hypothetical protein
MSQSADRLFELLPAVYRQRDADHQHSLQALLQVIAKQVNVLEDDLEQLYDNWFIETCQDWVVPYIGELIGYQPAREAGAPGDVDPAGQRRNRVLFPRRDVANTVASRRRRGTLAAAARQGADAAGWPARAVEFYALLGHTQSLAHLDLRRGRIVDLRDRAALDRLGGPFDALAHTVDTRRLTVNSTAGRFNIPSVGLFVWTMRSYGVTMRQPYSQEGIGPQFYTFSALGNDAPLFAAAAPPDHDRPIDDELHVPVPIDRRLLEQRLGDFYGIGKSIQIWRAPSRPRRGQKAAVDDTPRALVPAEEILVADLTDWQYRTPRGKVAVDPVLGRIAFPPHSAGLPRHGIWVTYHYGFSADVGGGEYPRPTSGATEGTRIYQVGEDAPYRRINQALQQWTSDAPRRAFIEITDSAVYTEQVAVELGEGQSLELRAASGCAPVIRLLDWQTEQPDQLTVTGAAGSCFVLDGILQAGRGMRVAGELARLLIRHSTLVPGWSLQPDCQPHRPAEPSLELDEVDTHVTIEHSIVGSIQVWHDEVLRDPGRIDISDSIVDATSAGREAIGGPGRQFAHAVLDIRRSTVIGQIQTHAIVMGENSIFHGIVRVARRQLGCVRFCWVQPGSRTPRRYNCQPDLACSAVDEQYAGGQLSELERNLARTREELRVQPEFVSVRYGTPAYCRLALTCAEEIRRGADDDAEMGVFHDTFQPQRLATAQSRLQQFTPATADAAVIIANEERI